MSCHVVTVLIVINNHCLPMIGDLLFLDFLIYFSGFFGQIRYSLRDGDSGSGVGTVGPVVLVAQIGHSDFLVEIVLVVFICEVDLLEDFLVLELYVDSVVGDLLLLNLFLLKFCLFFYFYIGLFLLF
jgi:hypothetical protein